MFHVNAPVVALITQRRQARRRFPNQPDDNIAARASLHLRAFNLLLSLAHGNTIKAAYEGHDQISRPTPDATT